jgi:2-hydroxy-6-oxonona-2,4-dienedioate hydrolase
MLKWLVRAVLSVIALLTIVLVGALAVFPFWRAGYVRTLEAESRVISTDTGDVEYAVIGEGTPLLYVHGAPGGYDQGLVDPRSRPEAFTGLQTITLSRPGYLRTPLSSGRTPAEQADLFAALLDEIGTQRVVVMAVSAGGPSAVQFAIRYPARTAGLVLMAPAMLDQPVLEYENPTSASGTFLLDFVLWAAGRWLGPAMLPGLDDDDPNQVALARTWVSTVIPLGRRTEGAINDFAMLRDLDVGSWPLETISAPTLIMHGDADRNAPYKGSVVAAERIPNAELVTFANVGHELTLTRARDIDEYLRRFLQELRKTNRTN